MSNWQRFKAFGKKWWRWTWDDLWPFVKRGTWPLGFAFLICTAHFVLRAHIISMCSDGGLCARAEKNATTNHPSQPNPEATGKCCDPPPSGKADNTEYQANSSWIEAALPENLYQKFTFGALLLSIFVTIAINFYSPDDYRDLGIRDEWIALLVSVIPTMQVLAVVVASLTVHNLPMHSVATLIFLWLFVVWDVLIIRAEPISGRTRGAKGDQLRVRAKEYCWRIDIPFAFTFTFLALLIIFSEPKEGSEPFIAGVLSSQAVAATFGLVIVIRDEYRRFLGERSGGVSVPAPAVP
jgi:hypothetical protein